MAERIKLKRGLIIEVNLEPTRGSETGKIRPCIIVTNNTYNERVPIIQVVPITAWSEKKAKIRTILRTVFKEGCDAFGNQCLRNKAEK
ncbi:type II toxin-antitoxin system PemK/MazF family toxin [Microcoleus sp. AT3-A2]|uniref:type II toxin-antitoxin system PemK/MazF family toxin n=1 Tax=Microcoleus sp. AT3-A2 TaxID=2818610 RepID=UPI002FD5AB50